MDAIDDLRIQEDLYLSRGSPALFVHEEITAKLARHQVEGLRFLYRQFTKKKPGVILNDPSGYGKKAQITIFLNVIKHVVTQPMLVLCNETEICKWKHNFSQWTDVDNDIIYESNSPYTNKKIFVNTFDYISEFSRQDWSVVVVDDPVSLKLFKPLRSLRPAFRIWIVSIDLKAHLNTFEAIHEWVRPASAFPRQMFVADKSNIQDVIDKAILLDSYFEDIVLRRGTSQLGESQPDPIFKPVAKVSRKNKDPTGTKVKRSKKKINVEQNIESTSERCSRETNKRISDGDESAILKPNKSRMIVDDKDNDKTVIKRSRRIIDDDDSDIQITKRNRTMIFDDEDDNKTINNDESNHTNHGTEESFTRNYVNNDYNSPVIVDPLENNFKSKDKDSTESSQDMKLNLDLSNHSENYIGAENVILNQRMDQTECKVNIEDAVDNEISKLSEKISDQTTNNIDFTKYNARVDTGTKSPDSDEMDSIASSKIESEPHIDIEFTKNNDEVLKKVEVNSELVVSKCRNNIIIEKEISNDSNSSDEDVFKMTENILTNVFFNSPSKKVIQKSDREAENKNSKVNNINKDSKCNAINEKSKEINVLCEDDVLQKIEKEKSLDELQTSILDTLF